MPREVVFNDKNIKKSLFSVLKKCTVVCNLSLNRRYFKSECRQLKPQRGEIS